jgi:hypothetical protein
MIRFGPLASLAIGRWKGAPRRRRRRAAPTIAALVMVTIALGATASIGGPRPARAGTVDTCTATPENCSSITVTLTGNGQGYYRTDDGFVNCVRSGGITSGSCSHTYDLSGGAISFGVVYAAESTSCLVQGATCETVGSGWAAILGPGQALTGSVEFRLLDPVLVTVKKAGTGTGTVTSTPRGIKCGSDCKSDYAKGATLTLKAAASSGSKFVQWVGGPCDGQGATCTFKVGPSVPVIAAIFDSKTKATAGPTEAPATAAPTPVVTPGPTPVVPTPFKIDSPTVAPTAVPLASSPPLSRASDDSGRSTLILALGSLLVVILAAGALYAMRSRRGAGGSSPGAPPQAGAPSEPNSAPPPG